MSRPFPAKLTMRLPPLSTKTVWLTYEGGHVYTVDIYSKKPEKNDDGYYDSFHNRDIHLAGIGAGTFEEWFGFELPLCKEADATRAYKCELTAPWDEHGRLTAFRTDF
jgi:hypothetical protein